MREALLAPALAQRRELLVVDIRSKEERMGGLGYIPGSRNIPLDEIEQKPDLLHIASRGIVLYCLTGKRSKKLLGKFPQLYHLEGGLLAWKGTGLPTAGLGDAGTEDILRVTSFQQLSRALLSCFVAETAEHAPPSIDTEAYRRLIEKRPTYTAEGILGMLNDLSEMSWEIGIPLETMVGNLDRINRTLHTLAKSPTQEEP